MMMIGLKLSQNHVVLEGQCKPDPRAIGKSKCPGPWI